MEQSDLLSKLIEIYQEQVVDFLEVLPRVLGALGVLLAGFTLAHLLRLLVRRLLENLDRWIPSLISRRAVLRLGDLSSFADLMSRIVFWSVFILSLTLATEVVGLNVVSTWLGGITTYLPQLFAAVLIGFVGYAAGKFASEMIVRITKSVGAGDPQILGRTVQIVILIATGIIVAGQIGINVSFLTQLTVIVLASLLGGAALAFGIGSRTLVSNILAVHYLRQHYRIGQTVKIGEHEGRILEFTSTTVMLDSDEGRIMVPAKEFEEMASILVPKRS